MPKLKYTDLPPFRWYPVEEVEIESGCEYWSAIRSALRDGEVRWGMEWLRRDTPLEDDERPAGWSYLSGGGPSTESVRFVMRLLTPDVQRLSGMTGWHLFRKVDGQLVDCTPEIT